MKNKILLTGTLFILFCMVSLAGTLNVNVSDAGSGSWWPGVKITNNSGSTVDVSTVTVTIKLANGITASGFQDNLTNIGPINGNWTCNNGEITGTFATSHDWHNGDTLQLNFSPSASYPGEFSASDVTVTTGDVPPQPATLSFTADQPSSTSDVLHFSVTNGTVVSYSLKRNGEALKALEGSATDYTDNDLEKFQGSTVSYDLTATLEDGSTLSATTSINVPSPSKAEITGSGVASLKSKNDTEITLTWATQDESGAPVTVDHYTVTKHSDVDKREYDMKTRVSPMVDNGKYNLGVYAKTTYYYTITAYDSNNTKIAQNVITVSSTVPPTPPTPVVKGKFNATYIGSDSGATFYTKEEIQQYNLIVFAFTDVTGKMSSSALDFISTIKSMEKPGTLNLVSLGGEKAKTLTVNQTLANNLVQTAKDANVDGVDLDLEASITADQYFQLGTMIRTAGGKDMVISAAPQLFRVGGAPTGDVELAIPGQGTSETVNLTKHFQSSDNPFNFMLLQAYNVGTGMSFKDPASGKMVNANQAQIIAASYEAMKALNLDPNMKIVIGLPANIVSAGRYSDPTPGYDTYAGNFWGGENQQYDINHQPTQDQTKDLANAFEASVKYVVSQKGNDSFSGVFTWSITDDVRADGFLAPTWMNGYYSNSVAPEINTILGL